MSQSPRSFVLVGHCGPDMHMLKSAIERAVLGATVTAVRDEASLQPHLTADSVLLINRVLESGTFGTSSGVELIQQIAQQPSPPVMMLISNYADAQQQAMAAGAMRGFGKAALYAESTTALLREAAGISKSAVEQQAEPA